MGNEINVMIKIPMVMNFNTKRKPHLTEPRDIHENVGLLNNKELIAKPNKSFWIICTQPGHKITFKGT